MQYSDILNNLDKLSDMDLFMMLYDASIGIFADVAEAEKQLVSSHGELAGALGSILSDSSHGEG